MQLSDFDYELPTELIAQEPLAERDSSRMLVIDRARQTLEDKAFVEFPNFLNSNDTLVINNTRVFPARLRGYRAGSGGAVELLLVREVETNVWEALTRPARRLQKAAQLVFSEPGLKAEVIAVKPDGIRVIRFETTRSLNSVIDAIGEPPLPPYIKRDSEGDFRDQERYQTVYATERGAIAAPTAGLHFTPSIVRRIENRGVNIAEITLHVGYGTFAPVRVSDLSRHSVAPEWYSISDKAAAIINAARDRAGRIVSVGTTSTRALESSVSSTGRIKPRAAFANLTIVPGYRFKAVDALLTNFHLPRSSLLMLVSAFAGHDLTLAAYRHAVSESYRFYSYGDCMLIL
jgi:S-adenosylmethionine:tRNA ribosyltransferase-isomerase